MASITFEKVTRHFPGQQRPALKELDLQVEDGEFLVLVGPSGCGKSTTLRLLAGMDQPSSGEILLGGERVTDTHPRDRDTAMVFQNYALYPHMSVAENIGFALKMAKVPAPQRRERVAQVARMLDLEEVLDRKPGQLSGGQRQRCAMGRALVRTPKAFLLDEPLSNLDASLRLRTRAQITDLTRRLNITTLYVTHDQTEAMTMGDRVAVLKDGQLQQVAKPDELYNTPANAFVAHFIGNRGMNLVLGDVRREEGRTYTALGQLELAIPREQADRVDTDMVIIGVRAEDLVLVPADMPGLDCEVVMIERLGASQFIYLRSAISPMRHVHFGAIGEEEDDLHNSAPLFAVQLDHRATAPAEGSRVRIAPETGDAVHFFHPDSGQRL
ncbi:ABC transporter ATP-binding protein [Micrococcoides hystricis]